MVVGKSQDYTTTVTVDDENGNGGGGGGGGGTNGIGEAAARSANALWKRAEQLKRWQDSETNRENPNPLRGGVAVSWSTSTNMRSRVKFSDECVFLAACASADIDEVERLLEHGADINTTNVDGMTALHQAVIDQNLDVVQYLVENHADIDAQDNEGWTPLMAGVSCEFKDIVRYLLDKGADPSAVNSDGELPLDLTDSTEMRSILEQEISRRGINLEEARHREEQSMMRDALDLLNSRTLSREKEKRHPRTGATALHVAAAKGYIKVVNILIQAGSDVNAHDHEGWTPLHAAAHWGEQQACEILVEHMADMDIENHAKQTCFDVADSDELCQALEEMKKKQEQEQIKKERKPFDTLIEQNSSSARQLHEYKVRKNSVTRISTDSKKNIAKSDETKEAETLRTASSSEASDNEQDEKRKPEKEESTIRPPQPPPIDDKPATTPTTPVATTPPTPAASVPAAAVVERKRQEVSQPVVAPPKQPKLEVKEKPVATTTAAANSTANSTTTSTSSPLAAVSVTVLQPTRPRQITATITTASTTTSPSTPAETVKSTAKLDEWKTPSSPSPLTTTIGRPTHGPPVIVPSATEPSIPPWRLSGRRGLHPTALGAPSNENGTSSSSTVGSSTKTVTASPSTPTVVSVQVTSTTAPTPSKVTVMGSSPMASPSSSESSSNVKWRQTKFEKHMSLDDEKSYSSKLPWARSSNSSSAMPPAWMHLIQRKFSNSASSSPVIPSSPVVSPPPMAMSLNEKIGSFTFRNQIFSPPPMMQPSIARPLAISAMSGVSTSPRWTPPGRHALSEPAASSASSSTSPFRAFTPPQRSEESEAERKVRAKRERESRRSTQGVALEAVKMAEQMYGDGKKGGAAASEDENIKSKTISEKGSLGESKENKPPSSESMQRPSTIDVDNSRSSPASSLYPWRSTGRVTLSDSGSDTAKSESSTQNADKSSSKSTTTAPLVKRLQNYGRSDQDEAAKDTSSPSSTVGGASSPPNSASSSSSATTANIPNRKRLRNTRRSTGPVAQEDVQLALDDQEGQMTADDENGTAPVAVTNGKCNTTGGGDHKPSSQLTMSKLTSGTTVIPIGGTGGMSPITERKNVISGNGSISEQQTNLSGHRANNNRYPFVKGDSVSSSPSRTSTTVNAANSTELDYKKLYEREKVENERLLEKVKYLENLIESTRMVGGKQTQTGSGDPGQPLNERERRTLEKRIAQLEDDTKVVEQLRADNQRLKEENGALIRVISKLSK